MSGMVAKVVSKTLSNGTINIYNYSMWQRI